MTTSPPAGGKSGFRQEYRGTISPRCSRSTPLYGPRCAGKCLPGSRIENGAVISPGMFWQMRHVFWTQADVVIGAKAIAGQYEALPPAVVADHRCVGGKLVEGRQFLFSREHALEFGTDCPPLGLDRAGPWEDGFVVNRRISHRAQCKIEMLHASDDSHEKAGDERRTLQPPDADGGRF